MDDMSDASRSLRKKQFEASHKERTASLLASMIRDFDKMISDLDEQIATEEDRTRIKDTAHPAYSTFAKAAAKRRQNLTISAAQMKSLLEVAKRELDEAAIQSRNLESMQSSQPPLPAPASSMPDTISAAR